MVAERGSTFTIFVKASIGNTITLDVDKSDAVDNIKSKILGKEGTFADQQRLTFSGKEPEDERLISDYNVTHGSTLYTSGETQRRSRSVSRGDDERLDKDVRTASASADGACS